MVKPVAGEIVVVPFPRTDSGKRRPAFVIADLPGADLILCQITSRAHFDGFAVTLDSSDCERGQIDQPCYIRPPRLFSVEHHIILHSLGKVTEAKLEEVLKRAREFFKDKMCNALTKRVGKIHTPPLPMVTFGDSSSIVPSRTGIFRRSRSIFGN